MSFAAIFNPASIALIGASRDSQSVGFSLLKNLLEPSYTGHVYPVNPKADTVLNQRCYHSIEELPDNIDLAIIAIPAPFVLQTAEQAIHKGIKGLIIISAGFKEQGNEGKQREQELVALCTTHNIPCIGPNCLGILNPHIGLNASFETVLPMKGSIGLLSQSGALISSLLDIANERGIGFSKIVSVGNKAAVSESELLPYLFEDPETKVITMYTEALKNAPELISLLRTNQQSAQPKPVIVLKAGITEEGQHASSSHTGSLAGSDMAYQALMKQAGMIRVHSMEELLTTAHVFATNPLPKGNRIAIVTNAGGPGIIATDAAASLNLSLAHFSSDTNDALTQILPANAHPANPVDLLGDARSDRYEKALRIVANDPNTDCVVVIVTPQTMTDIPETAASIIRIRNESNKPIAATFIGATQTDPGDYLFSLTDLAHSQFPEPLVRSVGHLAAFADTIRNKKDKATHQPINVLMIEKLTQTPRYQLDPNTVFALLRQAELPVVQSVLVQSEGEAQEKAKQIGTTLALKIVSADIIHKSDSGGVLLHIAPEDAGKGFKTILENVRSSVPQARTDGVLITEMITGEGVEFFLGVKYEPSLGHLLLVGLGGIYVEVLKDVSARFAPLTLPDAFEMIEETKANAFLHGVRGKPPLDKEALAQMLVSLSNLALSIPGLVELDINPVFVRPVGQSAVVVDARITIDSTISP